jgi:hypothetical protein
MDFAIDVSNLSVSLMSISFMKSPSLPFPVIQSWTPSGSRNLPRESEVSRPVFAGKEEQGSRRPRREERREILAEDAGGVL